MAFFYRQLALGTFYSSKIWLNTPFIKRCNGSLNEELFAPNRRYKQLVSTNSLLLPPGPGWGNGTYQSTPKIVHASLMGTSITFLCLSPRQTPTNKFSRSPMSETWGLTLTRLSPSQCIVERLRIQQGNCFSWSDAPSANYPKQRLSRCTVP